MIRKKTLFVQFVLFVEIFLLLTLSSCNDTKIDRLYFTIDRCQMVVGQVDTLELFFDPAEATDYNLITWTSSDQSVVRVSQMGEIRAVYSGKSTVTASYRGLKASVDITVTPISLDMNFSKAVAYFRELDDNIQSFRECNLRLLSEGYSVGADGSISGAGYYLNMLLYVDTVLRELPYGDFYPSEHADISKYLKGYFFEKDNLLYVAGSFLGHTSIGSSSATAIEDGVMSITKNGETYRISSVFIGDRKETIDVFYEGDIEVFDMTLSPKDTLRFNDVQSIVSLGDKYGQGQNVFRATLTNTLGYNLQLDFIAPVSAESLPVGNYSLSDKMEVFSLLSSDVDSLDGALLLYGNVIVGMLSGEVLVKSDKKGEIAFDILLLTNNGKIITN